ncbi:MAG: lysophospholipid acyltransferase family protein, partial [Smithellaceae bacterium]|nr:lysophospholipid acyltransferase family protein [Smithellaceae bacterium]
LLPVYLFYLLSTRYRLIALHNLRRAFPLKGEAELRRIARGVYRNFAVIAAEYPDIFFLTKENIRQMVEVEGYDNYLAARAGGKGVLVFAAHFSNWEMQLAAMALLTEPLSLIYRPLDNPLLEEVTAMARTASGNTLIGKKGAIRESVRILKGGGMVGVMVDQNMAWQEGVFVNFFGRPACTAGAIAGLALRTHAQVIPSFMVRQPSGRYKLILGPPVKIVRTGELEADILANTQEFTSLVEEMVRKYPDQWLWVHSRWKTKTWQVEQ